MRMMETQSKKYRLLKDLPGVKAGTPYIQSPKYYNRYYPETNYENGVVIHESLFGLCASQVADPEWFEPIEERVCVVVHPDMPHHLQKVGSIWTGDDIIKIEALLNGDRTFTLKEVFEWINKDACRYVFVEHRLPGIVLSDSFVNYFKLDDKKI